MSIFFKKPLKSTNELVTNSSETPSRLDQKTNSDIKSIENDRNKIVIAKSEDTDLLLLKNLYSSNSELEIIFINKLDGILVKKNYACTSDQSKDCFASALSNSGFSIAISTYFSEQPRMILDLYLYNNLGDELFHVYYPSSGYRKFSFSESGNYFVLIDSTNIYVYDMALRKVDIFSPEDLSKSDYNDFLLLEEKHCIAFCYTQHPDKPFYHFTFSGHLIDENVFLDQKNRMNELSAETAKYYSLLNELSTITRPFSDADYKKYMPELQAYSTNSEYMDSALIYRHMGELELDLLHKEQALEYFTKALSLNPNIGVKRIVSKLGKELGSKHV